MDRALKADLHIHSKYSMDCGTPLEKIIERCLEIGINCVAIADHGTAQGGLELQKIAPFKVIVAEEVLTPQGEIMGMFLKETIPSGITVAEAVARIKAQGGLVCIPHPFDRFRPAAVTGQLLEELLGQIDIIEAFNSRSPVLRTSTQAQFFASKHGIAKGAGSDAHTVSEIGRAYVEMPEFTGRDDFLEALRKGHIVGRKSSPLIHFGSAWARLKKRL